MGGEDHYSRGLVMTSPSSEPYRGLIARMVLGYLLYISKRWLDERDDDKTYTCFEEELTTVIPIVILKTQKQTILY
jgi:hypothetical protein